jgi:hypothetical protein
VYWGREKVRRWKWVRAGRRHAAKRRRHGRAHGRGKERHRTRKRHGAARRHHRVRRVRRLVVVTRRVRVRDHGRWRTKRVPRYRRVRRVAAFVTAIESERIGSVTLSAHSGCLRVMRARRYAAILRDLVPALRDAAPHADIVIGETSPVDGVGAFIRELGRLGVPRADAWAHHPYPGVAARAQDARAADAYWLGRTAELAALVRDEVAPLRLDLDEFGVPKQWGIADEARAAAIWREAYRTACAVGARVLVAYQWQNTRLEDWDTALLRPGWTDTAQSRAFEDARC